MNIRFFLLALCLIFSACVSEVAEMNMALQLGPARFIYVHDDIIHTTTSNRLFIKTERVRRIPSGAYLPKRRYLNHTLFMHDFEHVYITSSKYVGGIYWTDGSPYPNGYFYYSNAISPTFVEFEIVKDNIEIGHKESDANNLD